MARKPKNKRAVTLSLDSDLIERLDILCEEERRTRTSAIEIAVEKYLENTERKKENVNG